LKVIIIGGGVTGMFTAYFLLKSGHEVTIVDKNQTTVPTSVNNAGSLSPAFVPAPRWSNSKLVLAAIRPQGPLYFSLREIIKNPHWFFDAYRAGPFAFKKELWELSLKSFNMYNEFFTEEGINPSIVRGGIAVYQRREDAITSAQAMDGKVLDTSECEQLGFKGFEAGAFFEESMAIDPSQLFNQMRELLRERGVTFRLGLKVLISHDHNIVSSIVAGNEKITGDVYVATGGSETTELLMSTGYNPRIMPATGLAMLFNTHGEKIIGFPADMEDYGIGLNQHNQDVLRVTSFMDIVGFNKQVSASRKESLLGILKRHLSNYNKLELFYEGIGYRPCTPDQFGIAGKVPGYKNLFVGSGNCRVGVTLAPVTGYILSAMINGNEPKEINWQCLDPSRFTV
jgi:D-amino-acid dehydrogenase